MRAKNVKALAGVEMYVCRDDAAVRTKENGPLSHLCVLAKGPRGWKNLIKAVSASTRPEFFYRKPRLDLERIGSYTQGEFIVFSGHPGSTLADCLFEEPKAAYSARSREEARSCLRKDHEEVLAREVARHQTLFGKENFYLEIQLIDWKNLPASEVIAGVLRDYAKRTGSPRVATGDSHYCRRDDARDQRVLLCSALKTNLEEVGRKMDAGEDIGLGCFFRSNAYHIPEPAELRELHDPEELDAALEIAGRCEAFSLGGRPLLPKFCDGAEDRLRQLCREGWRRKVAKTVAKSRHQEYAARVEHELGVIHQAEFSDYFLIVHDVIRHAREDLGVRTGLGRGSVSGSMVSYLLDITKPDPIEWDLPFERFINASRLQPGSMYLPDVDIDFPVAVRDRVVDYMRTRYGEKRVAHISTFTRLQGRNALRDVLRVEGRLKYEEINQVTAAVPDESRISDQLQEMLEETGEASIIRWALENHPEELRQWCYVNDEGELDGDLYPLFAQAIRLEGTRRDRSRHASGIVVSSVDLDEVAPMTYDRGSKEMMLAVDMRDAEELGLVKFDILGLGTLDRIMAVESLVRTGEMP